MKMEEKTALAGTKRRLYTTLGPNTASALSRRITRMGKQLKQANPTHLMQVAPHTTWPDISTSGTIYDICSNIAQGDDYNNRFANHVDVTHLNFVANFLPGTTSSSVSTVRITLLKAQSGLGFASNMSGSYSPIVSGTSIQQLADVFVSVAAVESNPTFSSVVRWSKKIRHRQKFTGSAAGNLIFFQAVV
uniref:Uncharacterized protein n=1 Tax=uncultured prokaryote TaxID=198431 RepID=A0A0H5Q6H1_9ZZZZ|nr:hypothetical protein [uncultured prokaryote]